jgi:peptide/nickel transport system ATP-binding protein
MSLLAISDLRVTLGERPLLEGISLQIAPGEILALTGESGSGKSLTALSVMGLLPLGLTASGRVSFDGTDLLGLPERALCDLRGNRIGKVFQEPMTALNPLQTIGHQIAETLRQHGHPCARQETVRLLEKVRLDVPPERYPHELSGGQRQRVVIAMAIACRPHLLIADEPTTALDVTTQAQILDLLRDLTRDDGMALLLITHDLAVVAGLADRIAVMRAGRIVETGTTPQVLRAPEQSYTQDLLTAARHKAPLPKVTPNEPLLSVDGLSCHYPLPRPSPFHPRPKFTAVNAVRFRIHRGERVGLVGESGCGKSTLTRALLGLHPDTEGTVVLDGTPLPGAAMPRAARRKIQMVFQDPYGSFDPRHRVSRLLSEPFHLLDNPPSRAARETAVAEALQAVGLRPEDAHRHIHAFSGGQRQRLAIARALITKPELLILDEAVSALDVRVRAQILDLLAGLCRDLGLTWLFISHDMSVVRSVADRVMVMRRGEIVESGPTEELYAAPKHPYTRALLAATPELPEWTWQRSAV